MEKLLILTIFSVLTFILVACGNNDNEMTSSKQHEDEYTITENLMDSTSETEGNGEQLVKFPEDYAEGVLYTTVTRGSTYEELYTSKEAIEAVQNGHPLPSGTVITLLIHRDGELSQYFVMEKRDGWGKQYPSNLRNGEWEYQAFTPDGEVDHGEDIGRCMSCHANRERDDYVNTFDEMMDYDLDTNTGLYDNSTETLLTGFSPENWEVIASKMNGQKEKDMLQKILLMTYFHPYKG